MTPDKVSPEEESHKMSARTPVLNSVCLSLCSSPRPSLFLPPILYTVSILYLKCFSPFLHVTGSFSSFRSQPGYKFLLWPPFFSTQPQLLLSLSIEATTIYIFPMYLFTCLSLPSPLACKRVRTDTFSLSFTTVLLAPSPEPGT